MSRPRLQHRAEYLALRAAERALGVLPRSAAERVGAAIGSFVRSPLGIRHRVVEENLRRAFPDADDDWIRETVVATYRHLGREAAAMIRLSTMSHAVVREAVIIPDESWATFEAARALGRGVILATGHYGNWEMAAAAVAARGVPIEAIVKRQSNRLVDSRIEQARRALGVETVEMRDAPRRIPRALAANRSVGIVADQDAGRSGLWVPFFGIPASTHRGPALFSLRLGAPIMTAVARRLPDGRYLLAGNLIEIERTGSFEQDLWRLTAAIAADLEREIRVDPAQYFWFHKRWKTRPPEEHPTPLTGTITHAGDATKNA